jgi:hypothetical protein
MAECDVIAARYSRWVLCEPPEMRAGVGMAFSRWKRPAANCCNRPSPAIRGHRGGFPLAVIRAGQVSIIVRRDRLTDRCSLMPIGGLNRLPLGTRHVATVQGGAE